MAHDLPAAFRRLASVSGPSLGLAAVVFTLAGTAFLWAIVRTTEPPMIRWADAPDHEGEEVRIEGVVVDATPLRSGGISMVLNEWGHGGNLSSPEDPIRIPVLVEVLDAPVGIGDRLRLRGIVEPYRGQYQLCVDDPRGVEVVTRWDGTPLTLPHLALRPASYVGAQVWVEGYLSSIWRAEGSVPYAIATLSDAPVNAALRLDAEVAVPLSEDLCRGDAVFAQGRFEYDRGSFSYRLILDSEGHVMGRRMA